MHFCFEVGFTIISILMNSVMGNIADESLAPPLFIFIPGRWPASSARPLTKASAQPPPAYDPDGHGLGFVLREVKGVCTGSENPLPRPPTTYSMRESSLVPSPFQPSDGRGRVQTSWDRFGYGFVDGEACGS